MRTKAILLAGVSLVCVAALADDPAADLNIVGPRGGPFTPPTFQFGIFNKSQVGMYWSVNQCPPWIDIDIRNGYLAPGGEIHPIATVNDAAKQLLEGVYSEKLGVAFVPQPGDFDGDQKVNETDADYFATCISGPAVSARPDCSGPDLDHDRDVDQSDFGILQRCFSGTALADRNCRGS